MGDRKARLTALAAKAGRTKASRSEEGETNEEEKKKSIHFRNYAPASMEEAEKEEGSAAKKLRTEETKSSALQEALQAAQSDIAAGSAANEQRMDALGSMVPKKVNWDLKRDLETKLAKLERRTQRAIVELLKERLEREANEQASGEDSSDLD